ncbi:bleomycin resistance protein [Marinibaculum pumilum]|uniref:Bleomycin resistance protein n=1 Tax=Marinibaculum pumilum TaxID=1766165 RepID=A0ABV7L818_9PROT
MSESRMTAAIPVLPVRETEAAAAFYAEKLGFRVGHIDPGYAILVRDGVQVHLWAATDEDWRRRDGGRPVQSGAESFLAGTASCRIATEGIAALHDACRQSGIVHPNGALADKPHGLREFAVLDPDGNLVTFFQPLPAA